MTADITSQAPPITMARTSALIMLICALAVLVPSMPSQATAVTSTGRSLTNAALAPAPADDIDSAEDVADETEQEAEEVGADIEDGTETAVDETADAGEEAANEVGDAGEEAFDETEEVFTDSAPGSSVLAVAVSAAVAGLAALAV